MSTTDLTLHVLRYAMNKLQEGDLNAVSELGLTPDQITTVSGMTVEELQELIRLGHLFLDLQIDTDRFDQLVDRARDEVQSRQTRDQLLRHQADARMMEALYGMTTTDVARRRRVLGLAPQPGRPRSPSPEQEQAIWDAWRSTPAELSEAERYLHVARTTGCAAQAVYRTVDECLRSIEELPLPGPTARARPVVDLVHHQTWTGPYASGGSS